MKLNIETEKAIEKLCMSKIELVEFKSWLKKFLIYKISDPLPDYSIREFPCDYLRRLYVGTKNTHFQEVLKSSTKELFLEWNALASRTETLDYYSSLIRLIAELPVYGLYSDIVEIAISGSYCGVPSPSEKKDIQTLLLRVLVSLTIPGDNKTKDRALVLAKKYVDDFLYTPLCFRLAWQLDIRNAINFISPLIKCAQERKFDLESTLFRFLNGCRATLFKEIVLSILKNLSNNELLRDFFIALFQLGIQFHIPNFSRFPVSKSKRAKTYLQIYWQLDKEKPLKKYSVPIKKNYNKNIIEQINLFENSVPNDERKNDKHFLSNIKDFFSPLGPIGVFKPKLGISIP